ncbi:MAG: D-alanyl-D-alanine carboxypeptidase, partial [Clostridia bacterium]|nr:D-alanyl-D-alanine carboxypeptidase [Clostridia bacterium]
MKNWIKCSILSLLCMTLLLGSFGLPFATVVAVESDDMVELGGGEKTEEKEEPPTEDAQGRPILGKGEAGILIDGKSGNVLYEVNSEKKMYPASTTKVMTALVALDAVKAGKVSLKQKVTVTAEMLEGLAWDGSNMALKEGEIISFQNLLYGLMIPSGNDAAMAIAYAVSGSRAGFVDAMNNKAKKLGLKNTHFKNHHGLHDEEHYTTAADMAVIARAAMKNETFRSIVEIAHVKIPPTNLTEEERYYINTNGLVSTMRYSQYYYPGATGIKTGYTDEAGNCLVASAEKNGIELITVLFHGEGVENSHKDTARLLDYGFSAFELVTPVREDQIMGEVKVKWGRSKDSVTLSAVAPVSVLVPKGTKTEELEIKLNCSALPCSSDR